MIRDDVFEIDVENFVKISSSEWHSILRYYSDIYNRAILRISMGVPGGRTIEFYSFTEENETEGFILKKGSTICFYVKTVFIRESLRKLCDQVYNERYPPSEV